MRTQPTLRPAARVSPARSGRAPLSPPESTSPVTASFRIRDGNDRSGAVDGYAPHILILVASAFSFVSVTQAQGKKVERLTGVVERVQKNDAKAILEFGEDGDKSVIPMLREELLKKDKRFGGAASNAQMALAKLGEKKQLDEILAENDSDDPVTQDHAIEKLAYVGGKEAIVKLGSLLSDDQYRSMKGFDPNKRGPRGEQPQGDVVFLPRSELATKALSRIVPNAPTQSKKKPSKEDIQKWRDWWKTNKQKYQ